jgi:hypothetical protein
VKTIPVIEQIRVSFWGDRTKSLCFRVEHRDLAFAVTDRECAEVRAVKWCYAFTDIARIVRAYPWSVTVLSPESMGRGYSEHSDCRVVEWHVDVVKLFGVIENRRIRQFLDKDEGSFTLDARRFVTKHKTAPRLGVMQLISRLIRPDEDRKYSLTAWAKALAIFSRMKREKWDDLLTWLSIRANNPSDRVWPYADGELGFSLGGLRGAVICRGDDWSSHT